MFSRIDSNGTTKMAEPSVDAISMKLYVWLPTVAENGGGPSDGRPGLTSPANSVSTYRYKLTSINFNSNIRTTQLFSVDNLVMS